MGIAGGGTIIHDTLDVNSFLHDKTCVCVFSPHISKVFVIPLEGSDHAWLSERRVYQQGASWHEFRLELYL